MADTTTELEVLDEIVDVLGGQSGQYETVVPVLRQIKELLASGITDPESIAEAVTAWLDEHPEATTTVQDGSITEAKLAQALKYVTIQPSDFPTLPYPVTRDLHGQYDVSADILADKDTSEFYHYYVDSVNGSDSNAGTSADAPVKSFKKALTLALNKAAYITIAAGSVFWDDDLYGEYSVNQSLVIDGNGSTLIWGVKGAGWTAYEGKAGVYVSEDLSAKACVGCVDMGADNKDMYGFYKGMKPAASIDAMVANTYFWDATNTVMYAYPRDGGNIADIHPMRASYGLRWNHLTASADTFMYLRNFEYIGSYFDSVRATAFPATQDLKYEGYFENISMSHGMTGDLFIVSNYDVSYVWGCKSGYSKLDAFNSHMNGLVDTSAQRDKLCVMVNCAATEAGWYDAATANIDNLYTAHEGMSILRCNCNGSNARGPMIADVNGCRSINLDCQLINAGYSSSSITAALSFNDVQAVQSGFITLQRVNVRDASHPSIAGLSCDCKLVMWDCDIAGSMNITKELAVTPDL